MNKDFYEEQWAGKFGDEYTKRVKVDSDKRVPIFTELLKKLNTKTIYSILEIGCNEGHNIDAISTAGHGLLWFPFLSGLEINKNLCKLPQIINGSVYEIPWDENVFDLVFTAGLLIHIPPGTIEHAMQEIARVSKRHVLLIEYPSEQEEEIIYRDFGDKAGCWKRPYGDMFMKANPEFYLKHTGHIKDFGHDDDWDFSKKCDYWIFEK